MSRKITFDETLAFQRIKSYHPLELTVVTGSFNVPGWSPALGIYVHQDNPITKLTLDQLDGIFGAARTGGFDESYAWRPDRGRGPEGNIRTWGQLGLKGEWAKQPINVYGLSLKYHQQMNIERKVFNGGSKWNEGLREYAHFANPDGSTHISNVELLKDLSKDRYGISYSNEGYIRPEHAVRLVALAEKEGGPYLELNIDNVRNRTYPLLDETYVYIDRKPGMPLDPLVKEFLRYILSREGQTAVMEDGKYLPLTAEVVSEQLKKLL